MDKTIKRSNKATLIAAALIITGTTAIFSTYANEELPDPDKQKICPFQQELTEEQKAVLERS